MDECKCGTTGDGFVSRVFDGPAVELPQMLDARERRAAVQRSLIAKAPQGTSLLCMTMAIPGPVKTSAVLREVFGAIREAVAEALGDSAPLEAVELTGVTGPEVLELVPLGALELKRRMVAIEQSHPWGRLVDLDVFDCGAGELRPISRTELGLGPRTCLICGGEAKACARSRTHSVEQMQAKIASIIKEGGFEDCGNQG